MKIAINVEPTRLVIIPDDLDKIGYLRAAASNVLIEQVTKAFADNEPQMLTGKFNQPLGEIITIHKVLDEIKMMMISKVYNNKRVLEVEAAGFEIIPGLLDLY